MVAVSCSLLLAFLSALFHQPTEAVPPLTDWSRVLSTFDRSHDSCRDITKVSGHESRAAADGMCEEAFKSLDRLRLNICSGWDDAKCRLVGENQHSECTCKISLRKDHSFWSNVVKTFRECAADLRIPEQNTGQPPAPTPSVQENWGSHDIAWSTPQTHLPSNPPGPYERGSTSRGVNPFGEVAFPSGAHNTGGASSSRSAQTPGGAATLWDMYIARLEGPPSYTPGASGIKISEPRTGIDLNEPPNPYECDVCVATFMSALALLMHKKAHNKIGNSHCDLCNSTYANRSVFLTHLRGKHAKLAEEVKAGEQRSGKFKCGDCGKPFNTRNGLRDHAKSHNTLETYCGKCDLILATRQNYLGHLKRRHPKFAKSEAERAEKQYIEGHPVKCDKCPKRFKNERGLRDHMPFHDGQTTCDECNAILGSATALAGHKRYKHQKHQKN